MRRIADPPQTSHALDLSSAGARRAVGLSGAAAILSGALTGALGSPLLPLIAVWTFLLPAGPFARLEWRLPAFVIGVLFLVDFVRRGPSLAAFAAALSLALAWLAGRAWFAARDRRLRAADARLHAIREELQRPVPATPEGRAARRLEELRAGLVVTAASSGGERAVLWTADLDAKRIMMRVASDGAVQSEPIPMVGIPLGWLAEEGQPLRFDARPPLSARFATILALRLDRAEHTATLLTIEYGPGAEIPDLNHAPSIATEVVRLLDALDEQAANSAFRARVDVFLDTLRELPESSDPETFALDLVRGACRLTGGDGGTLALWDGERGTILACDGERGGPAAGLRFNATDSEIGLVARAAACITRDLGARSGGPPAIAAPGEKWQTTRPAFLIALALFVDGAVAGVLGIWSASRFDADAIQLLESLAPFAGTHLGRALEFGRVRESAERDPLTGLPNRRAFERALDRERLRFDRYRHPVALLVIDVDHFKSINDAWGHEAGDQVLSLVAATLDNVLRDVDTIARHGGEEFVALLPETDLDAARDAAERVRSAIEHLAALWQGTRIPVRVSIGVSSAPACVHEPGQLMRSADAALYEAKNGGRNRVSLAPADATQLTPRNSWEELRQERPAR